MFDKAIRRNKFGILIVILTTILLSSCSSDDGATQLNIGGTWSAYWYDEVISADYLIIDGSTETGVILGRWYDADEQLYYSARGTINGGNVNINVDYSFAWDLAGSLNADNNTVTGNVTISGTDSALDDIHPLRLVKVN